MKNKTVISMLKDLKGRIEDQEIDDITFKQAIEDEFRAGGIIRGIDSDFLDEYDIVDSYGSAVCSLDEVISTVIGKIVEYTTTIVELYIMDAESDNFLDEFVDEDYNWIYYMKEEKDE